MLDIQLLREDKGGNPDLVRESQRRRGKDPAVVDQIIELDSRWRKARYDLDDTRRQRGEVNDKITKCRKGGDKEGGDALVETRKPLEVRISELEVEVRTVEEQRDRMLAGLGNLVHQSVPTSGSEADNAVEHTHGDTVRACTHTPLGTLRTQRHATETAAAAAAAAAATETAAAATETSAAYAMLHHDQVLTMIDGYDAARGVQVAGHRGYFLKGMGVRLNLALISYGLSFLSQRGYEPLQTPFFMRKDVMAKVAQLEQFDEELYKVVGDEKDEHGEQYLIATSEQPIAGYHLGEWLDPHDVPKRYAGYSTCFRKEAGSHGKDTWGVFRVHQFEKIEQFCITAPDKSWEEHERMLQLSRDFYESLGLSYRVVSIVSGALNNAAAKKYDLEAWFPAFAEYRELVSCSNCTDYQARRLGVRYGAKKSGEAATYAHMLNSTLTATERTLCCLLENYQTADGVEVPLPLRPFMGGVEFIPYTRECPLHSEPKDSAKGKAAGGKAAGKAANGKAAGGKAAGGKGKGEDSQKK